MKRANQRTAWYTNLYALPIILTCIGLYFVFEGSSIRSLSDYKDAFFFVKKQAMWFVLGVIGMMVCARINYKNLHKIAVPTMVISIIFLVAVLIPGVGTKVNGARRWIDLGFTNFQPSEIVKSAVILYLAAWFQYRERQRIYAFILLLLIIAGLIMAQPDMGTAMITVMIAIGMYVVAGVELKKFFIALPGLVLAAFITAQSASYRLHRLRVLFDVDADPQGIGYHVRQVMIAMQNGGLLGLGFGGSKQKFLFLPEAHTDSIFAIFVEELGFVGSLGLICLYALFLYYLYRVVVQMKDRFGFMLGSGILLFFGLQSFLNLAAMTRLAPLTGVPLPFMSYGGTSLFVSFCLTGIMINLASQESAPQTSSVSQFLYTGIIPGKSPEPEKEKVVSRHRKEQPKRRGRG